MAKYKCTICGHIYDEAIEKVAFEDLPEDWVCPKCLAPKSLFIKIEEQGKNKEEQANVEIPISPRVKKVVETIHKMAETKTSEISAMTTTLPIVSWDEILVLGAQLNPPPLLESEKVSLKTVIGKNAKQPLEIELPVFVSHMSFGALSKEAKLSLAKGSAAVKTAICSGEGGILPEEQEAAYQYIFEYVPNQYSVTDENLQKVSAIEIKIGQGTKPGMGGHLPGNKVTKEIAQVRKKEVGKDIISPAKFEEITSKEELKKLVDSLRTRSKGRPIGIKIAAGHIEEDLEYICYANPDFITIDGRGGATGASPTYVKDATTVPTIYALYRAKKYLQEHNEKIDIIITGGLYKSSDYIKALALGADAVAIATAAMIALGCEQYQICHTGMCPKGIATQDEELRKRLSVDKASKQVENYFATVQKELETFCKITGHKNIHEFSTKDIITTSQEIANNTNVTHA